MTGEDQSLAKETDGAADWRPVLAAAVVALLLAGGLLAVFGGVSSYDRPVVLDGLTESVYWLAAALIGACSTIAALMLTTLGLLEHLETRRLTARFLFHLRLVVGAALATIALAVFALLLTVFPTSEAEGAVPASWQVEAVYWTLLGTTALMVGSFALVLGALSATIGEVFGTLPQRWIEEILTEEEAADAAATTVTVAHTRDGRSPGGGGEVVNAGT
jgi:hypothetical protein